MGTCSFSASRRSQRRRAGGPAKCSCAARRGEATGHSHRIGEAGAAVVYDTVDDMFLEITAALGTLVHEEHGPIQLPQGVYRVWTQREYTPARIVRVVD